MCRQLKTHFETPGNANVQSLLELASGMNRKGAARLFYQTCGMCTTLLSLQNFDYIRIARVTAANFVHVMCSSGDKRVYKGSTEGNIWRHPNIPRSKNVIRGAVTASRNRLTSTDFRKSHLFYLSIYILQLLLKNLH